MKTSNIASTRLIVSIACFILSFIVAVLIINKISVISNMTAVKQSRVEPSISYIISIFQSLASYIFVLFGGILGLILKQVKIPDKQEQTAKKCYKEIHVLPRKILDVLTLIINESCINPIANKSLHDKVNSIKNEFTRINSSNSKEKELIIFYKIINVLRVAVSIIVFLVIFFVILQTIFILRKPFNFNILLENGLFLIAFIISSSISLNSQE